jgi:hypothetical protein
MLGLALTALAVPAAATAPDEDASAAQDPKRAVYVEVNSNDMANVADYTLVGTNRPAFDMAMIFAANINYDIDRGAAYLHLNDRVTETLQDAETQIRPLQERGTKVLLSVLGNHQGAGIANFPSREAAAAFAEELAETVDKYDLDGIDFDDEWSRYGENGTGQPNDSSFVYLVDELRDRLDPEKLITFYNIGPAAEATEYESIRAGELIDYAWNPWYGSWQPPQIPGMDASQLAPGAIDLTRTSQETAAAFAQRTADEGYGAIVTYNLTDGDHSEYISSITKPLTGLATAYRAAPVPDYDVTATCAGGDAKLKVKVVNNDDENVDIDVISSVAARTFSDVGAGEARTVVQHAKGGAVADGELTVRVTGSDGKADYSASYAVPGCR